MLQQELHVQAPCTRPCCCQSDVNALLDHNRVVGIGDACALQSGTHLCSADARAQ